MGLVALWQKKGGYFNWYLQRVSTIFTVVFALMLFWQWLVDGRVTIVQWHVFLVQPVPFVISCLAMLSMILHAGLGLWTVFTDYIKHQALSRALNVCLLIGMLALIGSVMRVMQGVDV